MEWLSVAWEWLGHEVLHFGVRWIVVGAIAMLGVLIFGRGYKRRIAALEARSPMQIIMQPGATYNDYRGADGKHHLHFDGQGEIVSSEPVPVRVDGIGVGVFVSPPVVYGGEAKDEPSPPKKRGED